MTIDPATFPLDLDPKDRTYAALSEWCRSIERTTSDSLKLMNALHGSDSSGDLRDVFFFVGDVDDWKTEAEGTPSLKVIVNAGYGLVSQAPAVLPANFTTAAIAVPAGGNDRIDLVCWDAVTREIKITTGVESGSPSAPAVPSNQKWMAHLYLRDTMSVIKDADDATNGYIIDQRTA